MGGTIMKIINVCTFVDSKLFRYLFIISVFIWIGLTFFIQVERGIHLGMILLMGNVTLIGYLCKLKIKNNYLISILFFTPIILGILVVINEICNL